MLDFTNPNGQVDLKTVWIARGKDQTSDHQWLYFAWERDANKGSGFISYEFQKSALSPSCVYTGTGIDMIQPASAAETTLINTCNPWENRQAGDFLIVWDQQGNGLSIRKRVFLSDGAGGLTLGSDVPLGSALVAISADGFRGEATIDLTTDVFPPDGSCVNFANIIPGTITGNSDTADYKDTVLSAFPDISNCGTLTVTKVTQPTSTPPDPKSFSYTLDRSSGSEVKFDGTTSISDTVAHGQTDTHASLVAATDFRLNETVPAGYTFVSIACVIDPDGTPVATGSDSGTLPEEIGIEVQPSVVTACTITNRRNEGQLKIIKNVINDNGGTAVAGDFTMFVGNAANTSFAGSETGTTMTFDAGTTFNVSETGPSGYVQSMAGDCVGSIVVDVLKVCTVTNNDSMPSLTLNKIVVNDNGGTATASNFTLSAAGPTPLSGAGPTVSSGVSFDAGTYTLSESGPAGYSASTWSCVGGTQAGNQITVALGESATCTITNDDAIATPAGSTVQRAILHDTLNVTGIRPGGSTALEATFRLYSDTACSVQVGSSETVSVSAAGVATTSIGVLVTQAGSYRWRVQFNGNNFNQGFTTSCGSEITTLSFVQ
jgi:hypothetical protein